MRTQQRLSFGRSLFSSVLLLCGLTAASSFLGCDSARDAAEVSLNPPERRTIDTTRMGVNNFFTAQESFGGVRAQYREIQQTLGLNYIRVLVPWLSDVQPTPDSPIFFGFIDSFLTQIPAGVDVLVVLAHTPGWMSDPANWINGDPRTTFVERWVRPVVERYRDVGGIVGWEIWNEPDLTTVPSDAVLELTNPERYFQLLAEAAPVVRAVTPSKLLLPAATTSIQQNFPNNLDYNKRLVALGVPGLVDVWNVHFYGKQYERVVIDDGVADFLNSLSLPIWITESGAQGPSNQLDYVERTWPFLRDEIPGIDRIYYYQFASGDPIDVNYGLKTTDPAFPASDLYLHLKARAGG